MTFHIKPPRIPLNLSFAEPKTPLNDEDSYSDCYMEHCIFAGGVRGLNITGARLRNVRFEAALNAAEFEDVIFDCCDFSNVDFQDSILGRTLFQNCKMTGVSFSGATLKDTRLEGDILHYANFHFGRLERVAFTGCNCMNADFAEASLKNVCFTDTDLRRAQMSGTSLSGIDFTTSEIEGLGARPEDLKGSILSPGQAITAAKIMGITIRF